MDSTVRVPREQQIPKQQELAPTMISPHLHETHHDAPRESAAYILSGSELKGETTGKRKARWWSSIHCP